MVSNVRRALLHHLDEKLRGERILRDGAVLVLAVAAAAASAAVTPGAGGR